MPDNVWVRPRPQLSELRPDALLAVALGFTSLLVALLYVRTGLWDEYAEPWVWALGIGLSALPLAVRRRYPVTVATIVSVGFFICGQFAVPDILVINICLFIAIYTIGAWSQNRAVALWARVLLTAGMLAWLIVTLMIASSDTDAFPGVSRSGLFSAYATFATIQIITNLMYFGGAFYFGEKSWRSARVQAQLEAQGIELELERQTSAQQAVALDRIAIARELHDVVAHHVSVMGIQAAAARRTLDRAPEQAAESLEIVEASAHEAITELRRIVHTLRTPEAEDPSSTVGVAHLASLVAESQRAGTPASLIIAGEQRPLPLLVDVALYRVVQEALTNVRKHAGRGAEATVRLRFFDETVEVEVSDDGVRQSLNAANGAGVGLLGMRERIGAVGGTLHTGRREQGGFLVRATVPLATAPASPTSPESQEVRA